MGAVFLETETLTFIRAKPIGKIPAQILLKGFVTYESPVVFGVSRDGVWDGSDS